MIPEDARIAPHRAPLGYYYKGKRLLIDEENAKKVRLIFDMWASGVSYKAISEEFDVSTSTLYSMIKNPAYIGKIKYKGKLYNGLHKPIVSEEVYYEINPKSESSA